jgi:polyvinyl alcohol dehydrogenase (cytochrome)
VEQACAQNGLSLDQLLLFGRHLDGSHRHPRFAASMDGHFRAYAAADGEVVWDFNTAAEPITDVPGKPAYGGVMDGAGPTVVNGMVYVHSGYAGRSTANIYDLRGKEGNLLIAFSVDGK